MATSTRAASSLGSVNDGEDQDDLVLDFSNIGKPSPAGRYPGQTGTWKFADNKPNSKAGAGKHVQANIVILVPSDSDEEPKRKTLFTRYFLNEDSLWKFKQDMIALGADPADLEGENVRIGAVMRQVWGQVPTPIWATIDIDNSYIPEGQTTPRPQNNVKKLELRDESES